MVVCTAPVALAKLSLQQEEEEEEEEGEEEGGGATAPRVGP